MSGKNARLIAEALTWNHVRLDGNTNVCARDDDDWPCLTRRLADALQLADGSSSEMVEEFSFDYEPMPGLKYVTTNGMLAETMAAAKPGARLLHRLAPQWIDTAK